MIQSLTLVMIKYRNVYKVMHTFKIINSAGKKSTKGIFGLFVEKNKIYLLTFFI